MNIPWSRSRPGSIDANTMSFAGAAAVPVEDKKAVGIVVDDAVVPVVGGVADVELARRQLVLAADAGKASLGEIDHIG